MSPLAHLPSGSVSHFFNITSFSCHPLSVLSPPCVCSDKDSCIKASATPLEYQLQHSLRTVGGILCWGVSLWGNTGQDKLLLHWWGGGDSGSALHPHANMDTNFDPSMMKREIFFPPCVCGVCFNAELSLPIRPQWSSHDSRNQYYYSSHSSHYPWCAQRRVIPSASSEPYWTWRWIMADFATMVTPPELLPPSLVAIPSIRLLSWLCCSLDWAQ